MTTLLSERFWIGGAGYYFLAVYDSVDDELLVYTMPHGGRPFQRSHQLPRDDSRDMLAVATETTWAERDKYEKALKQEAWTKAHPSSYSDMGQPDMRTVARSHP